MITIAPEMPEDSWEVEALYDLCFAPGRTALSSYRLRDNVAPVRALSQVARDSDGILAGAIRFWPVHVGDSDALLLGPVAVHPTRQGHWQRVILVGDAPYYQRFGFVRLEGVEMPPPTNPERILGLNLSPNAWQGVQGRVARWSGAAQG